ncbi:RNA polymerase sigma factor [Candidatus Uabimicrobium sp. HlEnr_7]|uniref:RNA polymerase sigma factor n=1 Tax=Candidatus Uabimicrobium helgolandensis TaxID=3095367 RepID=UPI00355690E6
MDEWLIKRARSGDQEAFSMLVLRHQMFVVNICYQFLRVREDAEDTTQEVFIKLYRNSSQYQAQGKFRSYLAKIATNECLNRLRREKKMKTVRLEEYTHANVPPTKEENISPKLQEALDQLPTRQRLAFLMKIHGKACYESIASELECPVSAVGSLIFRARQTLQRKLKSSSEEQEASQ